MYNKIKQYMLLTLLLMAGISAASAGNYKSFKVSIYTRAYEVEKMKVSSIIAVKWGEF